MIDLPNNCRCSELVVYPKNWKTVAAKTNIRWTITYRFYDPAFRHQYPKGKQVQVKGMNGTTVLRDRRKQTQDLLDELTSILKVEGYNPIIANYVPSAGSSAENITELKSYTPFIDALQFALSKKRWTHKVKIDANSILKYTEAAARKLKYQHIPISLITSAHITEILEAVGQLNPRFSNYRYNKYLKCYTGLYKVFTVYNVVPGNLPKGIDKLVQTKMIRKTLTDAQRKTVSDFLYLNNRPFWKFVQIFFHSGGRETELMRLKGKDVDLKSQKYSCIILKGKAHVETERTIKNIALPFWEEHMQNCSNNDYVFSRNLLPGPTPIDASQIGRRWKRHVKDKLGITADFYSLKHMNATETGEESGDEDAAAQMGHTSTKMFKSTYDTKRKARQHERLKNINNKF